MRSHAREVEWDPPPDPARLHHDTVHVWRALLDYTPATLATLAEALSDDERARAGRFVLERDRHRFVACRGVLRVLLSRYLSTPPGRIEFSYSVCGKPGLSCASGSSCICFNLSHAQGIALYALTVERDIGVDLECAAADAMRDDDHLVAVAERFFAPGEIAALRRFRGAGRLEAFLRCWTRKEAYVKARGDGLSFPLDGFEVSLAPGEPPALLAVPSSPEETRRWSLRDLVPGPGYVAALAVEGRGWCLSLGDVDLTATPGRCRAARETDR